MPLAPNLIGLTVQLQAIVSDPGSNPAGFVFSDAMVASVDRR